MKKIEVVSRITGEVIELSVDSLEQLQRAWRLAQEYERMAKKIKDSFKDEVRKHITYTGLSEPVDKFVFRQTYVQRKDYDKALLRNVFDEDTLDLMLKPDKKIIDTYIKENLTDLPSDELAELRANMVDVGEPYEVIKLERL